MPLLSAVQLARSFGAADIFSGISLSIPQRARIGMVGPNGVGKTTLLRILAGLDEPSAGEVRRARGLKTGYLPQEAALDSENTLWQECMAVFADLLALQKELAQLETQMAAAGQSPDLLAAYGRVQAAFERQGGYTFETRIKQTLTGLGFDQGDLHRPVDQLSGGQRTRAYLARLLLTSPDLLLLDEPTNHLDIAAIEWLESYLKDWHGAALIVSHDRYFLDQVIHVTWEMTPALEVYHGNYSAFLQQRAARYQRRLEEYEAQQAFIDKEEDYIRRNIAGQNTRQAQGRRKRLERMIAEARLSPPAGQRRLHLRLEPSSRSGDLVLRTFNLSIGYADEGRPLFHAPDLVLRRGECAAILGPNGAGKTTFLKTILEQIPPYAGETRLGASLKIGYFAQAHEGLNPQHTLMQEIEAFAPKMLPGELRDYLAKFLFTGDDVFKEVSMLSGGERGRLALACLALQGANLLLLDEPTNHLDLPSQEALQAVLSDFNGAILLVSHDRYLIDALATQIWEVLPGQSVLQVFAGSYSDYKAARQSEENSAAQSAPPKRKGAPRQQPEGLSKFELFRRQQRIAAIEAEIAGLEAQMLELARQLEKPPADPQQVQRLGEEYNRVRQALEERMAIWMEMAGG
ncbi:MAG: ABC-F family ATP-binding cassette domain-containing protein [Anaerolineaceae bacterium]|jgi:ATP-binding cassette subfamily F protein 3